MKTNQNSQVQSISNIEKMVGQLVSSIQNLAVNMDKGKFPSQQLLNPKGVHEVGIHLRNSQDKAKSISILRNVKVFDNKVETPIRKTTENSTSKQVAADDSFSLEKEKSNPPTYIPKAPFPQRLAKLKQGTSTS